MAFKKKSAGTKPYFTISSSFTRGEDKKPTYVDHGAGWPFENKKSSGVSMKIRSLPLGNELVAYGEKGGDLEMYQSSGNEPDYRLVHTSTDAEGKTSYTEVGVGWSFDKRSDKDPEAPHGISFALSARPLDGQIVAFEFDEQEA